MPESLLRQSEFNYSACGTFTKHRKRIQKFIEIGSLKHFYRNELDKARIAHEAKYSDSKDLAKRIFSEIVLKEKAY